MSPAQQIKANHILDHINKNSDKIRMDQNGDVYINERLLKGVKINELIVNSVRNRAADSELTGQYKLFRVLIIEVCLRV